MQLPNGRFTSAPTGRKRKRRGETTNRRLNINTSIHLICEFTAANDAINIKKGKQKDRQITNKKRRI